ncbi:uncharacterized protein ACMZJ9_019974 [Mantella aurantiaca]
MEIDLLAFIVLIQLGFTTEIYPIYAHGKDRAILSLPRHLVNQKEYVWKKEDAQIAISFGNGNLYISDPKYSQILNSSQDGSLIIKGWNWEDDDEYSVNITMQDDSFSSIYYRANKYIQSDTGTISIPSSVGQTLVLQLDDSIIKESDIEQIDWLTERWVYFAATKVGGEILILRSIYDGRLSSAPNGSLIFTEVQKKDQGIYRACIFSRKGIILEQTYQVNIHEISFQEFIYGAYEECILRRPISTENIRIIVLCSSISFFIIMGILVMVTIKRCKDHTEKNSDPKEYNKTRTINDIYEISDSGVERYSVKSSPKKGFCHYILTFNKRRCLRGQKTKRNLQVMTKLNVGSLIPDRSLVMTQTKEGYYSGKDDAGINTII